MEGTLTKDQFKILQNHVEHLAEIDAKRDRAYFKAKGIHPSPQTVMKRGLRQAEKRWKESKLEEKQTNGMTYQEAVNSFIAELN